jgi:hypothetical protein
MREPGIRDVTVTLDQFAPYVSGLTEAARPAAEGPATRGPHRRADTIVAGGSDSARLCDEAAGPCTRCTGPLRGEAARDFYASVGVLTPPSIAEFFGIVEVEAMRMAEPPAEDPRTGREAATTLFGIPVGLKARREAFRQLPSGSRS